MLKFYKENNVFIEGLSLDQLERLGFLIKSNSLQMMGKLEVVYILKLKSLCKRKTILLGSPCRDIKSCGGRRWV